MSSVWIWVGCGESPSDGDKAFPTREAAEADALAFFDGEIPTYETFHDPPRTLPVIWFIELEVVA